MIEASRSVLNQFIPDIYLYSDVYKGNDSGKQVKLPFESNKLLTSLIGHPDMP